MILTPLSSCKALTKTEDMRTMISNIEDALSYHLQEYCELGSGVQESLCTLIIQLLDENFRAAHLPILNLIISTVQSGPITPQLEKVLAKAFVEPIAMQQRYTADAKTTLLVKTLFRLVDTGIKQKAFGVIATGSTLCFLLSIYNASSIKNVPVCLRIEAEQRIVRLLQLELPTDVKQKVLKPLMEDCILCLLSTTSVMKMLREPVENIDSILWLTALVLEQTIKYKLEIDTTLITALKVRISTFSSINLAECGRLEFQRSDDIFTQLKEVLPEQLSLETQSVPCLFPFLLSTLTNIVASKSLSTILPLLIYIYSFNMLLDIAILFFQHQASSETLLIALLTPHEAETSERYSTDSITEKAFLPLMQARCFVTHTCLTIATRLLPAYASNSASAPRSDLAPLLAVLIAAQYNMLLTNDSLSLSTAMDLAEEEFGLSFDLVENEKENRATSTLSLCRALYSLYSAKDSKSTKQTIAPMLYICNFSLLSWDHTIKKLISNKAIINFMTPSTVLATILSCYRLLSHDYCVSTGVDDSTNRYPQSKVLSFLRKFLDSALRSSEARPDSRLEELARATSALPCLLCLLSFKAGQRDAFQLSLINIQMLLYCSCVTQNIQQDKDTRAIPALITSSESQLAFVLLSHLVCNSSAYSTSVSKLLSYADYLIDLCCLILSCADKLVGSVTAAQCISHLLASLVGILHFRHVASSAQVPSPADTLYTLCYSHSDAGTDAITVELYDSINKLILLAMNILSNLNSNSLDCNSVLFSIFDDRDRKILQRSGSSVQVYICVCLQTQSQLLFRISHTSELRQRLLESATMVHLCEIFDAHCEGSSEVTEKDMPLLFGYGLLLGALTLQSLGEFDISSEAKNQLLDSLVDQSLFGNEALLLLFPASFRKLHSLLGLLSSTETFLCTFSQLCLTLTNEYKLSLAAFPSTTSAPGSTSTNENEFLFRLTLLSQLVIFVPLLCQDKAPNQAVIKLHQNCAELLTDLLEMHHALEQISPFADRLLHAHLLTLHRLFDFLDSKLVDAIEYLQVYEGVLTLFETQTGECSEEIWCIGLLRVVRLCSTPISAMRIKIVELLCKIAGHYISTCSATNALVLARDVLFKSMSILITCSPTTSRKAKLSANATIVSCHQLFFDSCISIVSSAPYLMKIQVIRAFISLMHSLSVATGLSMLNDSLRLFCAGMNSDRSQTPQDDDPANATGPSFEKVFSRVMQYPLMGSFFPEILQKSLEHSPWLSLLSPLDNENATSSLAALFDDILSLLVVDGKVSCQSYANSKGLSSKILLELCSVVFSLFSHLTEHVEVATQIVIHAITLIGTLVSAGNDEKEFNDEVKKAVSEIPVRLARELVCKFAAQNRESSKVETCLDLLLSYAVLHEDIFISVFTCLSELLKQSFGQEELCKLLSAQISKAFIHSCSLGTASSKTSSICLSIILTLYIAFSLTEAGTLAESLNIAAVASATLKLEAHLQLHLMLVLAICNNYPIFKGVINDDALYLIISRFLPHSNHYLADSSSSDAAQKASAATSFELLTYGKIDSEIISTAISSLQTKNEGVSLALEKLSALYSYDRSKQEFLVTIDSASLHQLLFNATLFTLSFYMESASTLKRCISLIKSVLTHVEYNHLHFHAIPPSERLYRHVSTLLKYIIEHTFPPEIALAILPHESMPFVYYMNHSASSAITLARPQLFVLQSAFFHFFKVCRDLPLSRQIELVYLEALTIEMKVT